MAAFLALTMICSIDHSQAAPHLADRPLGGAHLSLKYGRVDFDHDAAAAWGVDREGYLGLEAYWAGEDGYYFGGEVGHAGTDRAVDADGDSIRDFDYSNLRIGGHLGMVF